MDRLRFSTPRRPRRRRGLPGFTTLGRQAMINLLAAVFGLALLVYLTTGYWWMIVLLLAVAGAGSDQVLRTHPQSSFRGASATAIYLFVPVLFALGAALFFRDVSYGLWNVLAAAGSAVLFALAVQAEYLAVEANPATYPQARFGLGLVSYLTAFGLFVVVSTSDLRLPVGVAIVAVVALLLTVDTLRETDVSSGHLFAYGAAVAVVMAEVQWASYFLALQDLLAGALLLLTLYGLTGLLQSYLSGQMDTRTVREFGVVGFIGMALIAVFATLSRNA